MGWHRFACNFGSVGAQLARDTGARHVTEPAETRMVAELYGSKYGPRFGPPPPGDPPKLSEQATFELIPTAS